MSTGIGKLPTPSVLTIVQMLLSAFGQALLGLIVFLALWYVAVEPTLGRMTLDWQEYRNILQEQLEVAVSLRETASALDRAIDKTR